MGDRVKRLDGIVLDLPEAEYHARPELSSTQARQLLDVPARYKYRLEHPQEHKDAFDLGTAVHAAVLGTGAEATVLDFDSYRTKAAQQARDEAYTAGQTPILAKDYAPVLAMSEAVLANATARALFEQDGSAEASVFATDPATGVRTRARFDFLPDLSGALPIAVDLKTTAHRADKRGFERTVLDFGYETQERWYTRTLQCAAGAEISFVFVVVEVAPPHFVAVHQLDSVWRSMGDDKVTRALEIYAACSASGVWPSYPTDVQLSSPPTYAVYQHQELFG